MSLIRMSLLSKVTIDSRNKTGSYLYWKIQNFLRLYYFYCLFLLLIGNFSASSANQQSSQIQLENSQIQFANQVPIYNQLLSQVQTEQGESSINRVSKENLTAENNSTTNNGSVVSGKSKDSVKVEEILQQIFAAEFDDEDDDEVEDKIEIQEEQDDEVRATTDIISNEPRSDLPNSRQNRADNNKNSNSNRRRGQNKRNHQRNRQNNPKRKNSSQKQTVKKGQKQNQFGVTKKQKPKGKGVDLEKYNAYMDAVLSRMNSLIRKKRMDPLRVNLYAGANHNNNQGNKNKKNGTPGNNGKGKLKKKGSSRIDDEDSDSGSGFDSQSHHDADDDENEADEHSTEDEEDERSIRHMTLLDSDILRRRIRAMFEKKNGTEDTSSKEAQENAAEIESTAEDTAQEGRGKGKNKLKNGNKNETKPERGNKNKTKKTPPNDSEEESESSKPMIPKKKNSPRPTRGVLNGLSTLRRDGNVQVIKDGEKARIIRSRFLLGPVALEILPKKIKNKVSREDEDGTVSTPPPPAATATAPQLKGILEIRLSPGKPTRIRKLRVFPPGNIQVAGDNKSGVNPGARRAGYRKVTPMATARLRQAAVQVVRQVDNKMKTRLH